MTPEQFEALLKSMHEFMTMERTYTITGAADWNMLLTIGGLLFAAVAAMWADLRGKLSFNRNDLKESLRDVKSENIKEHDILWAAMRDCQNECCPRKRQEPRLSNDK